MEGLGRVIFSGNNKFLFRPNKECAVDSKVYARNKKFGYTVKYTQLILVQR